MNKEQSSTAAMIVALLAVGGLSWFFYLATPLDVDATTLSSLPLEVRQWRGRDVPMEGEVEAMLDADFNVQRVYYHPIGGLVWFYIGYYGTERGGRPEHTPWVCYPTSGWQIVENSVVEISGESGLRVNELLIEKDDEWRLVHFWYQSHRRTGMVGGVDQAYERIMSRILDGRADGSLVRLSTPLSNRSERTPGRARLISFGREMLPLLEDHWPEERKAST
jgi:EpsI family protein